MVTQPDHLLVLPVLAVWPVRLDDTAHTVDCAVESAVGNELGQVLVEPLLAHAESIGHASDAPDAVRLEQLSVRTPAHLAGEVNGVLGKDTVAEEEGLLDLKESLEEGLVFAEVEGIDEGLERGESRELIDHLDVARDLSPRAKDSENLSGVDNLGFEVDTGEGDDSGKDGVEDEGLVVAELAGCKGGERV